MTKLSFAMLAFASAAPAVVLDDSPRAHSINPIVRDWDDPEHDLAPYEQLWRKGTVDSD